ncbi:universal stress protein [Pseudomonas sp. BNK-45]|uniref:universal stress protein n=1 Tax=unclassified Pseudomonas TaxID=196821 RepID=UPI001F44B592|nr:universal stress protein [Pseudomonas sp. BC42]ULT73970.1 universal stress protein [Pseudomonas sp. BC42]
MLMTRQGQGHAARHQYHGLDNVLGSTTEHILYQVPCSVLAVKAQSAVASSRSPFAAPGGH